MTLGGYFFTMHGVRNLVAAKPRKHKLITKRALPLEVPKGRTELSSPRFRPGSEDRFGELSLRCLFPGILFELANLLRRSETFYPSKMLCPHLSYSDVHEIKQ